MTQIPVLLPGMVPLLPGPAVPGQAGTPTPGSNPFLALLTELVGAPTAPGEQAGTAPEAPVDADAEAEDGDAPDAEAPAVPVLTVLPQLAAALVVPTQGQAPTPATGAPAPAPTTPATPAATAPAAAAAPALKAVPDLPAEATAADGPGPAAPQQPAPVLPQAATTAAPPQVAPPQVAAASAVAPVAQVGAPAPATAPAPVAHQVFPEVVRMAVSGESPSRVVVRLEPEHLGEVRIVLRTGRAGLEVSLAGGSDARAAIREGAPELRRLLEAAGSPDARILVRHLSDAPATAPVAPATSPTPVRTDSTAPVPGTSVDVGAGTAGGTAHGERQDRPQQDAHPTATDGLPDRPVEPGRTTRASGLDVMM